MKVTITKIDNQPVAVGAMFLKSNGWAINCKNNTICFKTADYMMVFISDSGSITVMKANECTDLYRPVTIEALTIKYQ